MMYDVCLFWRVVIDALGIVGAWRVAVVVLLFVLVGYCGFCSMCIYKDGNVLKKPIFAKFSIVNRFVVIDPSFFPFFPFFPDLL